MTSTARKARFSPEEKEKVEEVEWELEEEVEKVEGEVDEGHGRFQSSCNIVMRT